MSSTRGIIVGAVVTTTWWSTARSFRRIPTSARVKAGYSDNVTSIRTSDATNVGYVERNRMNSVKVAQVFYRRTGGLFLHPSPVLHFSKDAEIQRLFFPALLALVLEPIQALIDTSVVGHLGIEELGAVGLGTVSFQFLIGFFSVFIFATTPLVADKASNGDISEASKSTCQGCRVALGVGIVLQLAIMLGSRSLMDLLSSDGTISHLADQYLQARSWGIPAALVMMVSVGAARGHKDMIAPLFGSVAYGFFLAIFDILFVFGADLGVSGAGYAASISQWIGGCTVMYMLYRDQKINISDLFSAPKLSDAKPYIAMAPSLALGNAAALAPVLASSSIATTLGPDQLAAHTILRQISTFWIQLFMAYNASAHSLVASSLSTKTPQGLSSAAEIMERICHLALFTTLPLSLSLYIFRAYLPMVFTDNAIVIQDVIGVLPILLVLMPFDALNVSLEGGILGAADTKWIASRSAAGSILSLAALGLLTDETSSLSTVWICLKLLNVSVLSLDLTRFLGFLPFGYTSEAQKFD